jgi:hypothetical protein
MNAFHWCQIDHHSAIDGRATRHVVAPAANRHLKAQLAREIDGVDNVSGAKAPGDQCRPFVHQTVVDPSCFFEANIGRA